MALKQSDSVQKSRAVPRLIAVGIIVMCLIALERSHVLSSSVILILDYIGIYSICVIGINLVNGYLGVFSLAHAGYMAVGAYASAIASKYYFTEEWMFPASILIGGLAALIFGIIVAIPSMKVKGDYLAIITLGFTLILQSIFQNMSFVGASQGMNDIPKFTNIYWIFGCLLLSIYVVTTLINSKFGRSINAIREDQTAAMLVSVNVKRIKITVFAISAFLIGISGALISHLLAYTSPAAYGFSNIVEGLIMVYLGGVGSITGAIFGSAAWQLIIQLFKDFGTWRWVIGGSMLCIIMVILPKGVFGYKEIGGVVRDLLQKVRDYRVKRKESDNV